MALPVFPRRIRVIREGFEEDIDYGVLRTEMDGGVAKQRPRYSIPIVTRQVTLLARTLADRREFDRFVREDIAGGAGWFTWTDPVDGQSRRVRIVDGKVPWQAMTVDVWKASCKVESIG
ncbi:hypothetical protein [Microvirgula aerodenitrificans]|uniref:hypothetical protein n=1 Tax=Microvirgula aerodenitrificans TaxID=57480 RepID=UPI00248F1B5B|nr:hypothetical protein [Microvirgula aerodenitrificans]